MERLQQAESILRDWQNNVAEGAIALRREIGDAKTMNDMADLVAEGRGKEFFDKFRIKVTTFIGREKILLGQRQRAFDVARQEVDAKRETVTQAHAQLEHTYEVLAHAAQVVAHAVDMETGYRGYMLTGESELLKPYKAGRVEFTKAIKALRETVADNPPQVKRLEEAEGLIREWIAAVIEPGMGLRTQANFGAIPFSEIEKYVSAQNGKTYFNAFRALLYHPHSKSRNFS